MLLFQHLMKFSALGRTTRLHGFLIPLYRSHWIYTHEIIFVCQRIFEEDKFYVMRNTVLCCDFYLDNFILFKHEMGKL